MKYTRLYADDQGISHFEDLGFELSESDIAPPAAPLNVSAPFAVAQCLFASVPQNWDGGWHRGAAAVVRGARRGSVMTPLILRQAQDEREGAADHAYAEAHTYRQAVLRHRSRLMPPRHVGVVMEG